MSLKICLPISSWKLSQVSSIIFCQDPIFTAIQKSWNHTRFKYGKGFRSPWKAPIPPKMKKAHLAFFTVSSTGVFAEKRFQDHQNLGYFAAALGISCCWSMEPTTSFGCFVCDIFHTFEDWGLAYFPEIMNKEMLKVTYYLPYTLAQPFIFPYTLGCMVARKTNASAVTNWPPNTCGKHCLIESWYSPQEYI